LDVYDCLEELESLGLITMLQPIADTKEKKDDETFRLFNITKEGLEELLPSPQKVKEFKKPIKKYFLLIILKSKIFKKMHH
jgi:hypothetical protein